MAKPERVKKAVAYIVRSQQLLVFRHRDVPLIVAGAQVPAGTIRADELPEDAALREATEETGLRGLRVICALGVEDYDVRPGRNEIHERRFFLLATDEPVQEEWVWFEEHDGLQPPTAFLYYWLPLTDAHVLAAGFGARIGALSDQN